LNPKIQSTALAIAATPASISLSSSEILQVRGLIPLLMRTRNRVRWTPQQRTAIRVHLRRLRTISPYLIVLALPGSFLILPALVWWLDRRRNHQRPSLATPKE
jgi:hypothetical protein